MFRRSALPPHGSAARGRFVRAVASFLVTVGAAVATARCGLIASPDLGFGPERSFADHREVDVRYHSREGTMLAGTLYLPPAAGPIRRSYFISAPPAGPGPLDRKRHLGMGGPRHCGPLLRPARGRRVRRLVLRGAGPELLPACGRRSAGGHRRPEDLSGPRTHRLGLFGFSQGGWVVPIAAALDPHEVAFTIIGSGPAVTLGEEELYST